MTHLYKEKLANSKAKGIDKKNSISFNKNFDSELSIIVRKINLGTYKFSPYVEKLKLKGRNKEPRLISIPTLRDRVVLLAIKEILHETFPNAVNRKLPNSYIRDVKKYLENLSGSEYYIKLDIEKFYDKIDREILLQKLKKHNLPASIIQLIEQALNTPTIPIHAKKETYESFHKEKGIPQGLSISNILAQIYLTEVDQVIDKRDFFYRRYVDDIIVVNHTKISNFRYKNIEKALNLIGLDLNHHKTEQNYLNESFTFLGYKITPNKISIADKNVELFIRRIAGKFTWFRKGIVNETSRPIWLQNNERFKEVFIEELNETITGIISSSRNYGWLFYFSEMTDESLLHRIDKIISRFFHSLEQFDNTRPPSLKKISRAYKVIKFQRNKNYIANYDNFDTVRRKREYLTFRGKIDPEANYTDAQIEDYFERFRKRQLEKVENDTGYNYN
ncbi:reverse transcriptase domain-containing protein [Marivirga arenosa]|uniref:Reverse transcriptase domain-containing protein n=1 Tax=Marivirga arenosa TaxID=3059076 RepID=A0AA51N875_9BACT|nr:reverse transcriptase domain-containing protein [Marivirga sp. ABR2-2]WMN07798.1 reverse transcriptase domain-containing protein [Marivirga sp. ABR2-2]